MKFTPTRQMVISTAETNSFSMAINEKSFSILTSGIYKNKIKAVIREYSTNALDSHIESGNLEPFEVHLPTEKECYFYVRDYGTGLDTCEFENIFFRFFESTKDKSNEYNGTMGLGSKVFFSYNTKSFAVESWKNGYHYVYQCFIGRSGVPEYTQLLKEYSQEPEGLKVQAAVNPDDIGEFEEEAKEVYKYFKRKPKFIGKSIDLEDIYTDDLYAIRKDASYHNRGSLAIMGNVCYPIESNYTLEKYKNILESNLLLFFDIGELTFTPSRESLEYTDYTLKNLKSKFEEVLKRLDKDITGKINAAKTEFEAIALYNGLYDEYRKNIRGIKAPDKLVWNGKELNTKSIVFNCSYFPAFRKKRNVFSSMEIHNQYTYIVNDLNIGAISRCQDISTKGKPVYLIEKDELSNFKITYPEFTLASSLPAPIRNQRKRASLGSFRKMLDSYYATESWEDVDIDISKIVNKYYIIRKGYNVEFNNELVKPIKAFDYIDACGIKDDIYGIPQKEEESIKKLGFINIQDAIKEKQKDVIEELDKNKDLINKLQSYTILANCNNTFIENINKAIKSGLKDSPCLKFLELRKFLKSYEKEYKNYFDKINNLRTMGISYSITQIDVKEYKDILDTYPFLKQTSYSITGEILYHYIKGVDYVTSGNV